MTTSITDLNAALFEANTAQDFELARKIVALIRKHPDSKTRNTRYVIATRRNSR